jgi:predicted N-acetyltransferase YhbS
MGRTALATSLPVGESHGAVNLGVAHRSRVGFRELAGDADWWVVRDLLVRTHASTPVGWNWEIRRWDGSRFHSESDEQSRVIQNGIGLWEADGRLVAAMHCEDGGDAWFELDPDYRYIEPEMLDWAESHLARAVEGRRRLEVYAFDYDVTRRELLAERGYTALTAGGWTRLVRFDSGPIPDGRLAEPYSLATTSEATAQEDANRMADLLNVAFGRTQHTATEYLRFMAASPSFSHDLNLVAVAPDGSFAAHVGVTYEQADRHGIFEPVCTHAMHLRNGLARALILEGMRRLREQGALSACVETGDMEPANALYRACGFTEGYRGHWFEREV